MPLRAHSRDGRKAGGRLCLSWQQNMRVCRSFTGATGLEPATSGVTGRSRRCGAERGYAGFVRKGQTFFACCAGLPGHLRVLPAPSGGMSAGCVVV